MLSALPVVHKRETVPRNIIIKALPPSISTPPREVLDRPGKLLSATGIDTVLRDVASGGQSLPGTEEANFIEQGVAAVVEEGEDLWVEAGLKEGVADLGGNNEAVLLNPRNAGGLFQGRGGETFLHESGDEWGVLEPEAEAVGEDFKAATGIERAEVGGYRGVG